MLRIALAGLGTVGAAVVQGLREGADLIASRAGQSITLQAVSARDKKRERACDISGVRWVDDPRQLAELSDIDVVVELMGGDEAAALELAEAALLAGKHFVTANKKLIAEHGVKLAHSAEAHPVQLSFEAAVGGGIPLLKTLREALAGDEVEKLYGILNGTCNYILTRMHSRGIEFASALSEAQKHGYAEADSGTDIKGGDTAHKLAILVALAFGMAPDLTSIRTEGIEHITPLDLQFAHELGCRVKLLGFARRSQKGVEQWVGPALIPEISPLAQVDGALNSVLLHGRRTGDIILQGRGAGGAPTSSAILADLIDIARGFKAPAFGIPAGRLGKIKAVEPQPRRHYLRLQVNDRPGVVAEITGILRDEALSIEQLLQRGKTQNEGVPVTIILHEGEGVVVRRAVKKIEALPTILAQPNLMAIEDYQP